VVTFEAPGYAVTKGLSVEILSDEKILLGGHCNNDATLDYFVSRFTKEGTLDPTFGTDGFTSKFWQRVHILM
jgi:hypothetical protein